MLFGQPVMKHQTGCGLLWTLRNQTPKSNFLMLKYKTGVLVFEVTILNIRLILEQQFRVDYGDGKLRIVLRKA